jgi:two-component system, LytTR family, sensor kinase
MAHPITSQRRALLIYLAIWILVIVANAFIIMIGKDLSLLLSFSDAIVSNVLFGLLGILVWYPTRYIPFQRSAPLSSITAHITVGILVILVWLVITISLLGAIFGENVEYNNFLQSSIFWRAILGILIYLVLILVYYLVINARSLREKVKAEERLRTLVKESELNMLKAQINPHFLFNSLNSVASLILSNPEEAQEMIHRLSDFIRYSLKHRESEYVTLKEEIGRMQDYLSIEKVRFGDKLIYSLETDKDCSEVEVPTMILQPLIENAIKHGVYESLDPVMIDFSCSVKNGYLELQIINDFDPDQPSRKGTGVGLQNVSERIRLVYDSEGSINWRIDKNKFIVTMRIPKSINRAS